MEKHAFELLHDLESTWWYRGRAAVVRQALSRVALPKNARSLDFGAGFGGMRETLSRYGSVAAFEPDEEARTAAGKRGYEHVYDEASAALSTHYDLIGLFDVLEHIPNDRAFLKEARDALTEKGILAITVPAMPFLWSTHDVTHHHHRRYTPHTLRTVLEEEGYELVYMSYWNMTLFPVAALVRLLGRSGETSFAVPAFINTLLFATVWCETLLMKLIPLPFGISLVALARKN